MAFKLAVIAAFLCATQVIAGKKLSSRCREQSGIDVESLFKDPDDLPEDQVQKAKDYALCQTKYLGFIDEDGQIQKAAIRKHIEGELSRTGPKTAKFVDECLEQKSDPIVTAWEMTRCFYKARAMQQTI